MRREPSDLAVPQSDGGRRDERQRGERQCLRVRAMQGPHARWCQQRPGQHHRGGGEHQADRPSEDRDDPAQRARIHTHRGTRSGARLIRNSDAANASEDAVSIPLGLRIDAV